MDVITAVYAPVGTPAAVVNRLNQETVRAIHLADIKEKFTATGVETVGSSPAELTAWMKAEVARTSKLVKDAGIRSE